jgi:cytidylate kinase
MTAVPESACRCITGQSHAAGSRLTPAVVAIDGPAASGKSTIGRRLAEALGYLFFDTGVMYRAVTWAALDRGLDVNDDSAMGQLADGIAIDIVSDDGESMVLVDGRDATPHIRSDAVDRSVSAVAAHEPVRSALSRQQRRVAHAYGARKRDKAGIVMVGRDIGTVVVPKAPLKVYLDATARERARRRYHEMRAKGIDAAFEDVLADVRRRDRIDSSREIAPLSVAADAVVVDTTGLTADEVVEKLLELVRKVEGDDKERQP